MHERGRAWPLELGVRQGKFHLGHRRRLAGYTTQRTQLGTRAVTTSPYFVGDRGPFLTYTHLLRRHRGIMRTSFSSVTIVAFSAWTSRFFPVISRGPANPSPGRSSSISRFGVLTTMGSGTTTVIIPPGLESPLPPGTTFHHFRIEPHAHHSPPSQLSDSIHSCQRSRSSPKSCPLIWRRNCSARVRAL